MAKRFIVELRAPVNISMQAALDSDVAKLPGFKVDQDYEPVPVTSKEMVESTEAANEKVFLIR